MSANPEQRTFTHRELVALAAQWLSRNRNVVVITELVSSAGEVPDALGFDGAGSTLIECKVSRSDFHADAKKYFRRDAWRGLGSRRYYMTPKGLLKPEELPTGWGLIEVSATGKARRVKDCGAFFEKDAAAEIRLLISVIRRVGLNAPEGVSIKCYTIQTECTATLGVAEEVENAVTETSVIEVQEPGVC